MEQANHLLNAQFDQVLLQIEAGQADQAIAHLTGLLDAVLIQCGDPDQIRLRLRTHPLGAVLRQPALAARTDRLGIEAALIVRNSLALSTLEQARSRGEQCLILQHGDAYPDTGSYDLILAPELLDFVAEAEVEQAIHTASLRLVSGGRLTFSFFVAGHHGCGWQTLWLGHCIERHAPTAIVAAARAAALEPRIFYDASGSLIWAELRKVNSDFNREEQP